MRTTLLRGILALTATVTVSVAPALAQSIVRGTVTDAAGQPVADATISFENTGGNVIETTTNENGEFMQVGLASGAWTATASKEGVGSQSLDANVSQGQNPPLAFVLAAAGLGELSDEERAEALALQTAAATASEHMTAGRYSDAIASYREVLLKIPTCGDCYYNIGVAYSNQKQYGQAETAFKQAIEVDPNAPEYYTGLANIYNAQRQFEQASEASAKAAELRGAAGGGGGAEESYNQGVILFNSGNFAGAKDQFAAAAAADPNMANAHYQLGMTALNLGQIPEAVEALEMYLKVAPDGDKAAEVKAALPGLQAMLKN